MCKVAFGAVPNIAIIEYITARKLPLRNKPNLGRTKGIRKTWRMGEKHQHAQKFELVYPRQQKVKDKTRQRKGWGGTIQRMDVIRSVL